MNKLLFADSAGPAWQKVSVCSHCCLLPGARLRAQPRRPACRAADLDGCATLLRSGKGCAAASGAPRRRRHRRTARPSRVARAHLAPAPAAMRPQMYSNSHYVLAALVPATLVSPQDGPIAKVADLGLAAAITVHNHVALNYGGLWGDCGGCGAAGAGLCAPVRRQLGKAAPAAAAAAACSAAEVGACSPAAWSPHPSLPPFYVPQSSPTTCPEAFRCRCAAAWSPSAC